MSKRRCVVPVSWYTEWRQESDPVEIDLFGDAVKPQKPKNVKYGFSLSGVDVTCLAGLYDSWANPDGEVLRTFTILTCEPNALTVEFHHRMPCLLDPDMVPRWLDPKVSSTEAAELLGPIDAVRMTYFAI
jgi:putative SOS response-associated peptidase YedK